MEWFLSIIKNIIVLAVIGFYIAYNLQPITDFFDVRTVRTTKNVYQTGEVIEFFVDRTIHEKFSGEFKVSVNDLVTKELYCFGSGDLNYDPSRVLPEPGPGENDLNLNWWIGITNKTDCDLGFISEPGVYDIKTCWTINRTLAIIPMELCVTTPSFKVVEGVIIQ